MFSQRTLSPTDILQNAWKAAFFWVAPHAPVLSFRNLSATVVPSFSVEVQIFPAWNMRACLQPFETTKLPQCSGRQEGLVLHVKLSRKFLKQYVL